jgi:ABC-type multidrug transport system fused ATPase/permease subunit
MHFKEIEESQTKSISISVRNLIMRQKKYLNIIKSKMYKKNNSQKLNIFVRACQIVFDVRSMIYQNDVHRINFVKSLLSNNVSELDWVWQRYRLRLDETAKLVSTWKQFCDFLKEQMSSTKLRITIVDQKIKLLHQRNNQLMTQLIVYLKTLEKQWSKSISNNLRASNLLLVLHNYLRKKIVRKNVNVANRKIVKKTARQIEAIEMKSHLKSQNKSKSKQNRRFHANNKRLRNENFDDMQLMTIVIADSEQKKARSAKNLSHIICYICDKAEHYKFQCRNDDIDKSSRKNRDRST